MRHTQVNTKRKMSSFFTQHFHLKTGKLCIAYSAVHTYIHEEDFNREDKINFSGIITKDLGWTERVEALITVEVLLTEIK